MSGNIKTILCNRKSIWNILKYNPTRKKLLPYVTQQISPVGKRVVQSGIMPYTRPVSHLFRNQIKKLLTCRSHPCASKYIMGRLKYVICRLCNGMQKDAFDTLNKMEEPLIRSGNPRLLSIWRYLQTSDHIYYMSTKKGHDGSVQNYFSPYPSPYQAFMNYMNVWSDLELKIDKQSKVQVDKINVRKFESALSHN